MSDKFKVVARLGLSSSVPVLINGEIGWDVDTKTYRVGDDTVSAPKVMSTKSTGVFEYPYVAKFKVSDVEISNGKVEGLSLKHLVYPDSTDPDNPVYPNDGYMSVNVETGAVKARYFEDSENIVAINRFGKTGNTKFDISEVLKDKINKAISGDSGENIPQDAIIGQFFWDTKYEVLYYGAPTGWIDPNTNRELGTWVDISSASGGGSGKGFRTFVQETTPLENQTSPLDEWLVPSTGKVYLRMVEGLNFFWMEKRI